MMEGDKRRAKEEERRWEDGGRRTREDRKVRAMTGERRR